IQGLQVIYHQLQRIRSRHHQISFSAAFREPASVNHAPAVESSVDCILSAPPGVLPEEVAGKSSSAKCRASRAECSRFLSHFCRDVTSSFLRYISNLSASAERSFREERDCRR